jgi:hypothetical protein
MWSGDQPDRLAAMQRPARLLAGERESISLQPVKTQVQSSFNRWGRVGRSPLSPAVRPLGAPLPPGIAVGTYLIADQFGRTEIRTVSLQDAFPDGKIQGHKRADQYTISSGKNRWHYIRLEQAIADRTARRPNVSTTTIH